MKEMAKTFLRGCLWANVALIVLVAVVMALACYASPSPWPAATNACKGHGGPKRAETLPDGRALVTCADGTKAVVQ